MDSSDFILEYAYIMFFRNSMFLEIIIYILTVQMHKCMIKSTIELDLFLSNTHIFPGFIQLHWFLSICQVLSFCLKKQLSTLSEFSRPSWLLLKRNFHFCI